MLSLNTLLKYWGIFLVLSLSLKSNSQTSPLSSTHQEFVQAKENSLFSTGWIPIGPVVNSARVEAVQAHPSQPGVMYAAFGSGNLWKTSNNGLTWKPIFENQAALGIGDIAIAPSDPNILYVGTGESLRKNRNFTFTGNGIYRSDDAGETWRHLGLDDSWHIGEIAVHPNDPNFVFVSVMGKFWSHGKVKGLYRTIDGGKNWDRVLYVDDNTRANDVVIAPSNPNIVYTSMWENNIDTTLMESVYGPKSGIYKSEDGGSTWNRMDNGLPTDPKIGRIGLAVSHQDANKVYALMDNRNKEKHKAEVYLSKNGGQQWNRTHQEDLPLFSVIGWYFADMYVNPKNDNEIYTLGVRLGRSMDGGKTFNLISGQVKHLHESAAQTLHLDHCEMWVNPSNPQHLILGNDGGLYVSYNSGQDWLHHNNIPTGEYYTLTLDNQQPYNIYAGSQDDATVYGPAKELNTALDDPWKYLWVDAWSGGDGCVTQVDPEDPNTVYFSMQNGAIRRRDMKADTSKHIAPRRSKENKDLQYNFVTPYFISPHDAKTIYHGGNFLMKTTDRGEHWKRISPDLSQSKHPNKKSIAAGAIAESHLQKGLLYVGTDHGAFYCSKDDGVNWTEFSASINNHYIRSIYPSRHKASRVYMAMTGMNYDELNASIYVSEDYGEHWKLINNQLPNEPVNVILEDPFFENILYAGTYRGTFISMDRGENWQVLGHDLPMVSVADMAIQEREKDLVIATHGRGLYYFNLTPIHELQELGFPLSKNHLFSIPETSAPKRRDTHRDVDKSTLGKVPISFYLSEKSLVNFSILDEEGKEIFTTPLSGNKGLNQFRWDMKIEQEESNAVYFIHYDKYLPKGRYKVQIKIGVEILEREFIVHKWMP